jgi:geranylgeranyl diphosphate synthase, type I
MSDSLAKLAEYKQAIDTDIAAYAKELRAATSRSYGSDILELEVDIFFDLLARGGKRIRGALVMAGYEMCGGKDRPMIVQAARAIEMLHAYILMIDDIQDRSVLRRGKPSAHKMLEALHAKRGFKGDAAHAGISLTLNAAIGGAHAAQVVLAGLDVDPELRLKAIGISNRTMGITAHGQTLDIINELVDTPSQADIERVLEWKTALYTVINPLQVGMVLAGADEETLEAITPYGKSAGKAFQITDDILGIYGDEKELGKTPGDDIREGKGTLLVLYALLHAKTEDAQFLKKCLGKPDLAADDFEWCKQIIKTSGALANASEQASKYLDEALASFDATQGFWNPEGIVFLKGIAQALRHRVA